jgi:hypothetical protein
MECSQPIVFLMLINIEELVSVLSIVVDTPHFHFWMPIFGGCKESAIITFEFHNQQTKIFMDGVFKMFILMWTFLQNHGFFCY